MSRRTRIALAAAVAAVSLVTAGVAAPSALAAFPDTKCNDTTLGPGPWQNVTVDKGKSCDFFDTTIFGDLKVSEDATLIGSQATIFGQLSATKANEVFLGAVGRVLIGEGVKATETKSGVSLCDVVVGGDVVVGNGNALLTADSLCNGGFPNIGGNLAAQGNRGPVSLFNTTAHGDITVTKNTGGGSLVLNHADGICKSQGNTPPLLSAGNTDQNGEANSCNAFPYPVP